MRKVWRVSGAVLAAFAVAASAWAQDGARTTAGGVYTKAQAERGQALYFEHCSVCHGDRMQGVEGDPGFADEEFKTRWAGKPLSALFNYINLLMPVGRPGVQGDRGSADIVAYILSFNGAPEGQSELPPDNQALKEIGVVATK